MSVLISHGKTKSLYETKAASQLLMCFEDNITAFNTEKSDVMKFKGVVNNFINNHVMCVLHAAGIHTHHVERVSNHETLVKRLNMIPLECVVRNRVAGGFSRRFGIKSGMILPTAMVEFFYKQDELGDPLVTDEHIRLFEWCSIEAVSKMREVALRVNEILMSMFIDANLILVDFKLEFGWFGDQLVLGDEFTPDSCRLWDKSSGVSLDKDRYRYEQGDVLNHYIEVARRLAIMLPDID